MSALKAEDHKNNKKPNNTLKCHAAAFLNYLTSFYVTHTKKENECTQFESILDFRSVFGFGTHQRYCHLTEKCYITSDL